ncbi:hypothetical protein CH339_07095 [Rhodobium orientis]|uniref:Cytochrome c n=2 Tax=Rhodobium orientis TaxID=34017 RepID=A0A327JSE3_9HYPH|nr:hypothetical protein [Rhodobium orientis]RAI28374.1 hypothetical protein CH339_07095 [Rhodobium orientis]
MRDAMTGGPTVRRRSERRTHHMKTLFARPGRCVAGCLSATLPAVLCALVAGTLTVAAPGARPALAEDTRELVEVAPEVRDQFLEEMRQDLINLDAVITAIAEDDLELAARIAERRIGLGHMRILRMEEMGAQDAKIAAAIREMRQMAEDLGTDMPKEMARRGLEGGRGVGRFMPEELVAIGQLFHKTAYPLADAARATKADPSAENYKKLFIALSDMTNSCLGCHEVFRVK